MAITKQVGRQYPLFAKADVALADLATGVASAAIELPPNAEVISGHITVTEAFDSTTSDVVDVGDSGSANRYLNDGSIHATGRVALVPTGYKTTAKSDITVTWVSGGGTPTAGAFTLEVLYVIHGRDNEVQG